MTDAFTERLRALGAEGEVVEFDTEVPTAAAAAEQLGCEVGAIANSLVFTADGHPLLVIPSGAHGVDTRGLERSLGVREIRRASPEFVAEATGQPVGGVGPRAGRASDGLGGGRQQARDVPDELRRAAADHRRIRGRRRPILNATVRGSLLRLVRGDLAAASAPRHRKPPFWIRFQHSR